MYDVIDTSHEVIKNIMAAVPFLRHLKERFSKKREYLLSDIERPFDVFNQYIERYGQALDMEGKVVLEVGPGNSLAMALLFLAFGAKKVFLVDRFKHLFWDKQEITYHEKVINKIFEQRLPFARYATNAILIKQNRIDLDIKRIEYRYSDAASLPFSNGSFDIIFSNAVLEHIHNIKKAVNEFYRITKTHGIGMYEVDLRDHFAGQNPLRLLQYPECLWNLMTWYRPGYSNRLRFSDYIRLFEFSGFEIQKRKITRKYNGTVEKIKLNRRFNDYSMDELRILAFWFVVRKK